MVLPRQARLGRNREKKINETRNKRDTCIVIVAASKKKRVLDGVTMRTSPKEMRKAEDNREAQELGMIASRRLHLKKVGEKGEK